MLKPSRQIQKGETFSIGLWHEIQNRLKNTWFDEVFHADSDSIFFLILKSIYRYIIRV
jgi:hypothetical protein